MNPGKQDKLDKANILSDAARMLAQLRGEAEKLKESNEKLRENIKDLKVYCSYSLCFLKMFLWISEPLFRFTYFFVSFKIGGVLKMLDIFVILLIHARIQAGKHGYTN